MDEAARADEAKIKLQATIEQVCASRRYYQYAL